MCLGGSITLFPRCEQENFKGGILAQPLSDTREHCRLVPRYREPVTAARLNETPRSSSLWLMALQVWRTVTGMVQLRLVFRWQKGHLKLEVVFSWGMRLWI